MRFSWWQFFKLGTPSLSRKLLKWSLNLWIGKYKNIYSWLKVLRPSWKKISSIFFFRVNILHLCMYLERYIIVSPWNVKKAIVPFLCLCFDSHVCLRSNPSLLAIPGQMIEKINTDSDPDWLLVLREGRQDRIKKFAGSLKTSPFPNKGRWRHWSDDGVGQASFRVNAPSR